MKRRVIFLVFCLLFGNVCSGQAALVTQTFHGVINHVHDAGNPAWDVFDIGDNFVATVSYNTNAPNDYPDNDVVSRWYYHAGSISVSANGYTFTNTFLGDPNDGLVMKMYDNYDSYDSYLFLSQTGVTSNVSGLSVTGGAKIELTFLASVCISYKQYLLSFNTRILITVM